MTSANFEWPTLRPAASNNSRIKSSAPFAVILLAVGNLTFSKFEA